MRVGHVLAGAAMVLACSGVASAQNEPLSQVLPDLMARMAVMTAPAGTPGSPHEAHFIAALGANQAIWDINKLLVEQMGTFPIGSSSAGFVFNFDPASGLFKPASQSFGPGFAERALTNGKGRFGFGLNFQRLEFDSYEGTNLQNGDLAFVLQHNDCCPAAGTTVGAGTTPDDPFFEGDLLRMAVTLNVKSDVVAPFVSYGLTNRWDVGVVVPIVHVDLSSSIVGTIDRIATCPNDQCTPANRTIHSFDGLGGSTKIDTLGGSASGVGDIVVRTKYRFVDTAGGGVAAGLDVRLPTGDKENLLGTGAVQTKVQLIASGEVSRISPHVNVGYTFSHGELSSAVTTLPQTGQPANAATAGQIALAPGASAVDLHLSNEVNYVGGIDIAAHSLVTISGDILGRTLLDAKRFGITAHPYKYRTANGGPEQTTTRDTFDITGTGSLNLLLGVVGAKVNIPGTPLLITANVLFPLTDAGLKPKVTPVFGLDYSFGK